MTSFKDSFCILPLRDIVVFPNMIVPLFVGRAKSIKALEYADKMEKEIFLVAQKDANTDEPNKNDIYEHGTLAHVLLGDKKFRGAGYGKELCQLMADYGFKIKNLHRLSASVHLCNIAAVVAYVKGGFIVEGTIRDVLKFDGKWYSLYQMSLLRSDWRSIIRE